MWRSAFTKLSLCILLFLPVACGLPRAELSPASGAIRAALEADPAGKISVVAAAAAARDEPAESNEDDTSEAPPVDCDQALTRYNTRFTEVDGMVEWHALHSLQSFQAAGRAANAANEQNCSPSLRYADQDCNELLGAFNDAFTDLRQTPQYQTLEATEEWQTLLSAYQDLRTNACVD